MRLAPVVKRFWPDRQTGQDMHTVNAGHIHGIESGAGSLDCNPLEILLCDKLGSASD